MPDVVNAVTWLVSSGGRRGALVHLLKKSPRMSPSREAMSLSHEAMSPSHQTQSRVVVVDSSPLSAAGRLADAFELVPTNDSPDFVDEILRIAKFHRAGVVIPTIDPEIIVYSNNRDRFRAADVAVWVSGPVVAQLGANKWDLYGWLNKNGFPTIATVEKDTVEKDTVERDTVERDTVERDSFERDTVETDSFASAELSGPVVAKPRSGSSSIGVMFADAVGDIDLSQLGPEYIIQQRAPGIELTVDFAVDKNGRFLGAVPRRRLEVRAGEVSKGVTVKVPAVEDLVRELAKTLPDAYGVLNVQLFVEPDSGAMNIIEINPRFGGGYPLSHHAGADFITALLRSDQGDSCQVDWEPGTVMLRYDEAAFFQSPGYAESPWQ
ncbi:MAG: carbamoyl-phosphate synthase large subunit [Actinomycetota bacterium]|nr:carbamoyl-phosphate synthase large subunit [Actinomycetota bacterium]